MRYYFHIPVMVITPDDIELVPAFCMYCGKEMTTTPNLEAYSNQLIGYMYHCTPCNVQISIRRESYGEQLDL